MLMIVEIHLIYFKSIKYEIYLIEMVNFPCKMFIICICSVFLLSDKAGTIIAKSNTSVSNGIIQVHAKRQYDNLKVDQRIVDLLVVCDFSCFKRHEEILNESDSNATKKHIKAYYSSLVAQANVYFERLFINTSVVNIRIRVKSFMILNTKTSSRFSTDSSNFLQINSSFVDERGRNYLNCDLASPMLNDWLALQSMENKDFPRFDAAVVFSFTDIYSANTDIVGYTVMKSLCSSGINGIFVEESGFSSVKTLVHELSHSIGELFVFFISFYFFIKRVKNFRKKS
jgi:hypothetical protein